MTLHRLQPTPAIATSNVVPDKTVSRSVNPECPFAGKLQRAVQGAHSRQEVMSILDDMYPPTTSAAKGKLLREAFAAVCLGEPWKVGSLKCVSHSFLKYKKYVCHAKPEGPSPVKLSCLLVIQL